MWDRDEGEERAGTYRKRCMIVVRPRCAHVGSAPQAKGEITSCRGEGPRPGSEMRGKDNVENTRSWNIEHNDTRRQLAQIPASSPVGHVRCSRRTRARCERRRAVGEDGSEIPERRTSVDAREGTAGTPSTARCATMRIAFGPPECTGTGRPFQFRIGAGPSTRRKRTQISYTFRRFPVTITYNWRHLLVLHDDTTPDAV